VNSLRSDCAATFADLRTRSPIFGDHYVGTLFALFYFTQEVYMKARRTGKTVPAALSFEGRRYELNGGEAMVLKGRTWYTYTSEDGGIIERAIEDGRILVMQRPD
jgi:hypothetical protein